VVKYIYIYIYIKSLKLTLLAHLFFFKYFSDIRFLLSLSLSSMDIDFSDTWWFDFLRSVYFRILILKFFFYFKLIFFVLEGVWNIFLFLFLCIFFKYFFLFSSIVLEWLFECIDVKKILFLKILCNHKHPLLEGSMDEKCQLTLGKIHI